MDIELQRQIDHYAEQISRGGPAHCYARLADVYRKSGLMQDAVHTARTGLQKHPESLLIQESLGLCLLDTGDSESAVRALAPVVEKLPENGVAAIALAVSLSRINRTADAVKVLHRRLEKDPIDRAARSLLVQLESGKEESAAQKPSAPAEPKFPIPAPAGQDQTDIEFVVKPADEVFTTAFINDSDAVIDMKEIFDERPRPIAIAKAAVAIAAETGVKEQEAPAAKAPEKPAEPAAPAPDKTQTEKKPAQTAQAAPPARERKSPEQPPERPAEIKAGFWTRLWRKLMGGGKTKASQMSNANSGPKASGKDGADRKKNRAKKK
jgi:tetratricopeptide (TPR) repeat protein